MARQIMLGIIIPMRYEILQNLNMRIASTLVVLSNPNSSAMAEIQQQHHVGALSPHLASRKPQQ